MKRILVTLLIPALGLSLLAIGAAEAAPKDGTHGQCVSSSPQPAGKGGRSAVATDKNACATPVIDCTNYRTNGTAVVDSAANSAVVSANAVTFGSSVECDLGIPVVAGQILTFDYALTDAVCGGGVPRIFVQIDGSAGNTFDDYGPNPLPGACGTGGDVGTATSGTVTYELKATGTLLTLGMVFDQGAGSATYSNVTVNGVALDL